MASRKILIIDDDAPTRSLFQALFERNGHSCVQTGDGREALDLLRTDHLHVILLDLLLPNPDGFAILKEIKASFSHLLPRTIVLTAAAERIYGDREELDGVWCILNQPVDIAQLSEEVDDCAEQRIRERKPPAPVQSPGSASRERAG